MQERDYIGFLRLMLAIQKPDLEDIWFEGYELATQSALSENPFENNSTEHFYWQEGWWTGFKDKVCVNDEHMEADLQALLFHQYFDEQAQTECMEKLETQTIDDNLRPLNQTFKINGKTL